ncbi:CAAX amino terminal protease family protein [Pyrodictium delaneyi]|uniref:CAAX amino terminal protease family protein n=1 Tax=Pyrodictium delaneyi TaxID=1273541 RepID=A0A0P0N544_9CREN|nr:CPBP family intramembrane glutamic endopeptidase [Pyrodictium delaneyi]ALL01836.1 CAAX amino terminal protease family protein [Pyrodictium delaneyi]OWJ54950.1 CPBP family intramembrane metalloprotease domain-containing protein [Pyrodictium delaneyi]
MPARNLAGILVFIAVSFGFAYAIDFLVILPHAGDRVVFALAAASRMYTPLAGAVVALLYEGYRVREGLRSIGLRRGRAGVVAASVLVPLAAYGVAVLASLLLGLRLRSLGETMELLLGVGAELPLPAPLLLVLLLLQAIVVGTTVNALLALGEEAGWRGYLLARLSPWLGFTWASVLAGLVWGLWHAPLVVLIGYNYSGITGLTPLLAFLAFTVSGSLVLAMLRALSGTVIAPAVAHGVVNAVAGFAYAAVEGSPLIAPPAGLAASLGFLAVAAAVTLYARQRGYKLALDENPVDEPPEVY